MFFLSTAGKSAPQCDQRINTHSWDRNGFPSQFNASSLLVIVTIEGEGIKGKDELGETHQGMGRWLQLITFVEELCECQ